MWRATGSPVPAFIAGSLPAAVRMLGLATYIQHRQIEIYSTGIGKQKARAPCIQLQDQYRHLRDVPEGRTVRAPCRGATRQSRRRPYTRVPPVITDMAMLTGVRAPPPLSRIWVSRPQPTVTSQKIVLIGSPRSLRKAIESISGFPRFQQIPAIAAPPRPCCSAQTRQSIGFEDRLTLRAQTPLRAAAPYG
jgi:hypothetical protein